MINNERYFTESANRSHTMVAQIKTKGNKWLDYEKFYSKPGFSPLDYINTYYHVKYRLRAIDKNPNTEVRILNGMRKQVFGKAAADINKFFECSGCSDDGTLTCNALRPIFSVYDITPGRITKFISIRFKNSKLPDMMISDINTEEGWNNFVKIMSDISDKNKGLKSYHKVAVTKDDDFLQWFKVKCNSGLEFSIACYR